MEFVEQVLHSLVKWTFFFFSTDGFSFVWRKGKHKLKQKIRTVARSSYITSYKFVQVPELLEADEDYLQKFYGGDVLSESDLCYLYWGESEIDVETESQWYSYLNPVFCPLRSRPTSFSRQNWSNDQMPSLIPLLICINSWWFY